MRYVCIHGHFYQPPRENPWLDEVEVQDSAAPYHDWNARISAECYWPNAAARLLGHGNQITAIVNNYSSLSFNFGPTLTAWIARHEPDLLAHIVAADQASCMRCGGHGNAIAQAYGHAILPLLNLRDKTTQVRWGVQEFVYRFGRKPEGMWLPETAVDVSTLEVLAAEGMRFTILAPHQARRIRPLTHTSWQMVRPEELDTTRPYLCRLPSGRQIVVFFYHGPLARAVAFEGLLNSGDRLVERIMAAFHAQPDEPQLVHFATDGESYGHHHRFGEMALAFACHELTRRGLARLTNYGEYLALHPPAWEAEIVENTSWSCPHGVERWRADCGCRVGTKPGWTQRWRAPLREALLWVSDAIDRVFEQHGAPLLADPWRARDEYIELVLDRTPDRVEEFCARQGTRVLTPGERVEVLKLLEMARHRLLMFTSCGWFFDELSGIEGTQILRYAARAIEYAEGYGVQLQEEFIARLRAAPSNLPEYGDGAGVYTRKVLSTRVGLSQVVANQAICQILEPERVCVVPRAFSVRWTDTEQEVYGTTALSVGRLHLMSTLTREEKEFACAVLRLTAHDVHCVVSDTLPSAEYETVKSELMRLFARRSLSEVVRGLDRVFGETYYTAKDLFLDDRRRVLARVSEGVFARLEETYWQLYRENQRFMEFLRDLDVPLPQGFALAVGFLLNRMFLRTLTAIVRGEGDKEALDAVFADMQKWQVPLETGAAGEVCRQAIEERLARLLADPLGQDIKQIITLLDLAERFHLVPNLWRAQTLFAQVCMRHLQSLLWRRVHEEAVAHQVMLLRHLGTRLGFYAVDGMPLSAWE
jgi:alpha-amylase/alpha-mannosidase (GH57 family)